LGQSAGDKPNFWVVVVIVVIIAAGTMNEVTLTVRGALEMLHISSN